MNNQKKSPITIGAKEGKIVSVVGDTYRILVGGAETNGAFAIIDMLVPPNGGPGPHEHAQIEESFYVIDGEIEVKSEFGEYIATKGSFVNIPKGGVVSRNGKKIAGYSRKARTKSLSAGLPR